MLQLAQLVAVHVLQASMPLMEVASPSPLLEKAVKRERSFLAGAWHWGQEAALPASLKGRRNSNLCSQLGQEYSYIGISPSSSILPRRAKAVNAIPARLSGHR